MEHGERVLIVWTIPEREEDVGQWGRVTGLVPLTGGGMTDRIDLDSGATIYGCECFTVPESSAEAAQLMGVDIDTIVSRARPTYARQAMNKHRYAPPT